jgi:hypothetical protein
MRRSELEEEQGSLCALADPKHQSNMATIPPAQKIFIIWGSFGSYRVDGLQ